MFKWTDHFAPLSDIKPKVEHETSTFAIHYCTIAPLKCIALLYMIDLVTPIVLH